MTKKDFELIALCLKCTPHNEYTPFNWEWCIDKFANTFESKYPKFDKQKFLIACGVDIDVIILDRDDIRNKDTKYIRTPWADN